VTTILNIPMRTERKTINSQQFFQLKGLAQIFLKENVRYPVWSCSDSRDPRIIFSDSRDPIFISVSKTPLKNLGLAHLKSVKILSCSAHFGDQRSGRTCAHATVLKY